MASAGMLPYSEERLGGHLGGSLKIQEGVHARFHGSPDFVGVALCSLCLAYLAFTDSLKHGWRVSARHWPAEYQLRYVV